MPEAGETGVILKSDDGLAIGSFSNLKRTTHRRRQRLSRHTLSQLGCGLTSQGQLVALAFLSTEIREVDGHRDRHKGGLR
jgi:hypothetical protein